MEGGGGNGEEKYNISSDLLKRFIKRSRFEEKEDEEMELSLGLSMNGRFGVDPTRQVLGRSSSISDMASAVGAADGIGDHARVVEVERHAPPLARTHSLPIETEEEWRRRKELQYMRRMEARKKRMKKLMIKNSVEDDNSNDTNMNGVVYEVGCGSVDDQKLDYFINGNVTPLMPIEQLIDGSSGYSDPPSLQTDGGKQETEIPPPAQEQGNNRGSSDKEAKEGPTITKTMKNEMPDMPYVTTKEAGANGKKIEGFLYKYRKGGVKIVCVCHGLFLTPAQFLRHGGCGDVEHPLKHIVVNPFPLF